MYFGYLITFDTAGSSNFDNGIAINVIMICVDIILASHGDNHKNNVLVLGESSNFGMNERFGS